MEKWETRINLKFRHIPWKFPVGFTFEWKAWLIAYELKGVEPWEFGNLPKEEQYDALVYGAAAWYRMKKGKSIFFSPSDISAALMKASKAENLRITHALNFAHFPSWLDKSKELSDKKKEES